MVKKFVYGVKVNISLNTAVHLLLIN